MKIRLLGSFALQSADGQDIAPKGRKAQAALAMLCTGRDGVRTRAWLQAHLWSDRAPQQASGSLRSCLHEIRGALGAEADAITSDRTKVQIDLSKISVDLREMSPQDWLEAVSAGTVFLEGFDIADPEFTAWLDQQRLHWARRARLPGQEETPATARAQQALAAATPGLRPDWALSLCVLPLENRSSDSRGTFVGSGLSDDLANALQRLRWLPVVRPPLLDGAPRDSGHMQSLVETLGARYFVNGSVTQEGNATVARFQLGDAEDCRELWSDSFPLDAFLADGGMDGVFNQIVGAVERSVSQSFQRQVLAAEDRSESFLDQIWRGRWHLARLTREDSDLARVHFDRAKALRPNAPEAFIQMAFWHLWRAWVSREGPQALNVAQEHARRAMELDPDDGRAFAVLGIADAWQRNHEAGITALEQALALNPNLAIAHHQLGSAFIHADQPEEALRPLSLAMRYSPRDQLDFAFQTEMAVALARTERFDEAYVRATRALMMKPRYWYGHLVRMLAAERMQDGPKLKEARRAYAAADLRITENTINWLPFSSDDWPNQLRALLR